MNNRFRRNSSLAFVCLLQTTVDTRYSLQAPELSRLPNFIIANEINRFFSARCCEEKKCRAYLGTVTRTSHESSAKLISRVNSSENRFSGAKTANWFSNF